MLNAAARVVSDTRKFDRGLTSLLHDELHWLDVPERVTYKQELISLKNVQARTMEGPKVPSEAWRREAPEHRGGGIWGGAP